MKMFRRSFLSLPLAALRPPARAKTSLTAPRDVDAEFMDNVAKRLGLVLHESYYRRIA